jgi:hypothetical protein
VTRERVRDSADTGQVHAGHQSRPHEKRYRLVTISNLDAHTTRLTWEIVDPQDVHGGKANKKLAHERRVTLASSKPRLMSAQVSISSAQRA